MEVARQSDSGPLPVPSAVHLPVFRGNRAPWVGTAHHPQKRNPSYEVFREKTSWKPRRVGTAHHPQKRNHPKQALRHHQSGKATAHGTQRAAPLDDQTEPSSFLAPNNLLHQAPYKQNEPSKNHVANTIKATTKVKSHPPFCAPRNDFKTHNSPALAQAHPPPSRPGSGTSSTGLQQKNTVNPTRTPENIQKIEPAPHLRNRMARPHSRTRTKRTNPLHFSTQALE